MNYLLLLLSCFCVLSQSTALKITSHHRATNVTNSNSSGLSVTFSITSACYTSAGIFQNGTLIRELWTNRNYKKGTYTSDPWDGKDNDGNSMPAGNYQIKVVSHNLQSVWEGTINTSTNITGTNRWRYPTRAFGMVIVKERAYFTVNTDEQRTTSCYFDLNNPQVPKPILTSGANTRAVCADARRVYWGADDYSYSWVFITNVSDNQETVLANSSSVATRYHRAYKSAINTVRSSGDQDKSHFITGMAVQQKGNYLFVARESQNTIHVLDKNTGALLKTIAVVSPRELAIDGNDNIWLISNTNTVTLYTVNNNGTFKPTLTLSGIGMPSAIAVSPDNQTIVVADGAINSQQLKAYSTATGKPSWILGQAGGYSATATVANDRFYFNDVRSNHHFAPDYSQWSGTFVSFQPDGSFWLMDSGNIRLLHFAPDHTTVLDQIHWGGSTQSVHVDKANPTRVFCNYLEYNVDYSKNLQEKGAWTLVKNWGANVPAEKDNPFDFRLKCVATLDGHTFALQYGTNRLEVVELVEGGTLRFTGVMTPNKLYWLYPDGGLYTRTSVYSVGQIMSWKKRPFIKLDGNNNPTWGSETTLASVPAGTNDPVNYNAAAMRPGEITADGTLLAFDGGVVYNNFGKGYHLGGIKTGRTSWTYKAAKAMGLNYTGDYPTNGMYDIGNGVSVSGNAGGLALALNNIALWNYRGEFWKGGYQVNKWQIVHQSGLFLTSYGTDWTKNPNGASTPAVFTPFPEMAGNVMSGNLIQAPNNKNVAYLYHSDESWHGGVHRWKISGLSSISEQTFTVTLPSKAKARMGEFEDAETFNISVYGNPISDAEPFKVRLSGALGHSAKFQITNLKGQVITDKQVQVDNDFHIETIDLNTVNPGLYLLQVSVGDQKRSVKIIKP